MAVTAQASTQVANGQALPAVKNDVVDDAKLRLAYFSFTQGAAAGDIGSTMDLVKFGAGKIRILPALSRAAFSAWGASATLDIGTTAYTKLDGTTGAAAPANIEDTLDVASAGAALLGVGTGAVAGANAGVSIESKGDITVQGIVAGAVVPAGATLTGWIAYVRD
jgi:hypothetical protein